MAGITSTGWETTTTQTVVDELSSSLKAQFGEDFPTSPDSELGQFLNIFAEREKKIYDLGQAVTDTQNLSTAEGLYLDYLAEHKGTRRFLDSGSYGEILVKTLQNVTIPIFTPFKDNDQRVVLTQTDFTSSRALCYGVDLVVVNALDNTEYLVVVNGVDYSYTSGAGATEDSILLGLEQALSAGSAIFSTTLTEKVLTIVNVSRSNTLTVNNSENILLQSLNSLIDVVAATKGNLTFPANTIVNIVDNTLNIFSVTNPLTLTQGRYEENDPELRARLFTIDTVKGTATNPSMKAAMAQVEGVTGVFLVENQTNQTDGNGIPARQFEFFISGGDDQTIAEKIYDIRPTTVPSHGDISVNFLDNDGDPQTERFSRKASSHAWVRVSYTINSEEDFPEDGEAAMQAAVISQGNRMYEGEDLVDNKFYGALYGVKGVFIDNIEIAVTTEVTDTPTYQQGIIPVGEVETLLFTEATVSIITS